VTGAAAALSLVCVTTTASADPFVITTGRLGFHQANFTEVDISGPHFAIRFVDSPETFGLPGLLIEHADPLAPSLPVSGHVLLPLSGPLILNDALLSLRTLDLTFEGNSAATVLNNCSFGPCISSATGPFRLSGELTALFDDGTVFRHALTGRGIATVGFELPDEFDPARAFAIYTFASTTATPEPSTLLLLALGALGSRWRTPRSRS